jgi:ATP/maltotriose-dependent transcriptional regulator MalT
MARGYTNAQIGRELHLVEETVKTYAQRLLKHLGAANRAHAVAIGYETGLLRHGDVTAATGRPDHPTPTTGSHT